MNIIWTLLTITINNFTENPFRAMTEVYTNLLGQFTWAVFFLLALGVMMLNAEKNQGLMAAGFMLIMLPIGFILFVPGAIPIYTLFVLFAVMGITWIFYRAFGSRTKNF